ncbi:MAG: putative zinc transporter ZupT [Pseudomonadota bacterium]|jgi:ZIP family zinc transporter
MSGRSLLPRQWIGLSICLAGLWVTLAPLWAQAAAVDVRHALLLSSGAALATALGVLPMLLLRAPSRQMLDVLLGFGAGVMLAASAWSLILPALQMVRGPSAFGAGGAVGVLLALLAGGFTLMALERVLPHQHQPDGGRPAVGGAELPWRRSLLFVLAIVLHNLPEGLALGVAAVGLTEGQASALGIGIALQDVPEGLLVALALWQAGMARWRAAVIGAVSGLVEPLAAVVAALALAPAQAALPAALAFAAGAMLFVVSHEVIPESHRQGHERSATTGLLLGFVLMTALDHLLA